MARTGRPCYAVVSGAASGLEGFRIPALGANMILAMASNLFRQGWAIGLAALFLATAPGARAADEIRTDYESWQLFCAASKPGEPQDCEIHQLLANKDGKLAAGLYLIKRGGGNVVMVRVPLGVLLSKKMMLQIGGGITTDALTFLRCDANGCIAQMPATEAFLGALRSGSEATVTMYADATKPVPVKFTLKGFAAAERALAAR